MQHQFFHHFPFPPSFTHTHTLCIHTAGSLEVQSTKWWLWVSQEAFPPWHLPPAASGLPAEGIERSERREGGSWELVTVAVFRKKEKKTLQKDGRWRQQRGTKNRGQASDSFLHRGKEKRVDWFKDRIQGQSGEEEKEDEGWGVLQKCLEGPEPFSERSAGSH